MVVEGGDVLHHVKKGGGIVWEGEMSGFLNFILCQGIRILVCWINLDSCCE